MNYCGIDVAMRSSYLYITDAQGRKEAAGEVPTTYGALRRRLRPFIRGGAPVVAGHRRGHAVQGYRRPGRRPGPLGAG